MNMKIKTLCFGFLFLMPTCLMAQSMKSDQVNRYNASGQKEGYWVEDRGFDRIETYYENGQKNGIFKSYTKGPVPTLKFFGEYHNDNKTGIWYYFDEQGHLLFTENSIDTNTDTVNLYDKITYVYQKRSFTKDFYPNGKIRSEGIVLWDADDDIELGDFKEFGKWKYYDEAGNLIETKVFK